MGNFYYIDMTVVGMSQLPFGLIDPIPINKFVEILVEPVIDNMR